MEPKTTIKVTVTFPLGKQGPFEEDALAVTTVGVVLSQAKQHFGVIDEPNVIWYLTARGQRQDSGNTVGDVASAAEAVSFRLVKEITQG